MYDCVCGHLHTAGTGGPRREHLLEEAARRLEVDWPLLFEEGADAIIYVSKAVEPPTLPPHDYSTLYPSTVADLERIKAAFRTDAWEVSLPLALPFGWEVMTAESVLGTFLQEARSAARAALATLTKQHWREVQRAEAYNRGVCKAFKRVLRGARPASPAFQAWQARRAVVPGGVLSGGTNLIPHLWLDEEDEYGREVLVVYVQDKIDHALGWWSIHYEASLDESTGTVLITVAVRGTNDRSPLHGDYAYVLYSDEAGGLYLRRLSPYPAGLTAKGFDRWARDGAPARLGDVTFTKVAEGDATDPTLLRTSEPTTVENSFGRHTLAPGFWRIRAARHATEDQFKAALLEAKITDAETSGYRRTLASLLETSTLPQAPSRGRVNNLEV